MTNLNELKMLSYPELRNVNGGREVYKYDLDGDGKWDVKVVVRNNGTVKIKTR